jgi:hypothetical protein
MKINFFQILKQFFIIPFTGQEFAVFQGKQIGLIPELLVLEHDCIVIVFFSFQQIKRKNVSISPFVSVSHVETKT